MYDDYDSPDYFDDPPFYDDRRRLDGGYVHLCPECRDLMSDVLLAWANVPRPLPEPDWSRALRWLDAICGGRQAVLDLDTTPLEAHAVEPAREPTDVEAQRLELTEGLLEALAGQFGDSEVAVAFRRGLRRCFECEPGLVMAARSPESLALGVAWAVGHANGLLWPLGRVTETALKQQLGASQSGAMFGSKVEGALAGPFRWQTPELPWDYRFGLRRDRGLKPLGHAGLLVSSCRRQLVEVRDRALSAQRATPDAA